MLGQELVYDGDGWILAFQEKYPYVAGGCVYYEQVAAESIVAFDHPFFWYGSVLKYIL